MKRFLILSLTACLMACGGLKVAESSYSQIGANNANAERDQYTFNMTKKAGDYIEIIEVKLLNEEKEMEESVPFQVMDENAEKTILDVKGREAFSIVASKPTGENNVLASKALIVYRTEKDGKNNYFTVKKIGSTKE